MLVCSCLYFALIFFTGYRILGSYFLPVFEDNCSIFQWPQLLCSVVSCNTCCCTSEDNLCPPPPATVACRFFYFSLNFLSICILCLCVYTDGVCSASGIWGLMSFISLGKCLVIISSNIVSISSPSLSLLAMQLYTLGQTFSGDLTVSCFLSTFSIVLSLCALD